LWALGTVVQQATDDGHRLLARHMFESALSRASDLGPRGTASTILGLVSFVAAVPGASAAANTLATLADKLVARYQQEATGGWNWFEPTLTYDNAMIPLALFKAYGVTGERASLRVAREALEFLEETCFHEGQLVVVGNGGWHSRGGARAQTDEQPID